MEEQSQSTIPQLGAPAPEAAADAQCPDISPDDRAMQHYTDTIARLVTNATKTQTLRVLVHVMIFNIARIIVNCGATAAGDVLERLGSDISYFAERDGAAKEAAEAREAGQLPH